MWDPEQGNVLKREEAQRGWDTKICLIPTTNEDLIYSRCATLLYLSSDYGIYAVNA
jgi:hypothetical protein